MRQSINHRTHTMRPATQHADNMRPATQPGLDPVRGPECVTSNIFSDVLHAQI